MRRWCLFTGVFFTLLLSDSSNAQQNADQLLARKHYELGAQLYKTSDYSRALVEFQESYRLSKKPGLLFNLARCHEVLANLEKAIKYYRMYLAQVPGTLKRSLVESRLRNLEKRAAASSAAVPPGKVAPVLVPVKPPPTLPPEKPAQVKPAVEPTVTDEGPSRPGKWKRTAAWIALGTGGALLVTGIVFGTMASGKATDYEEAAKDQTYDDLADLRQEGESLETAQVGLMVAGSVVAAAGAGLLLWYYLGGEKEGEPASAMVAPVISETSVGLCGQLRF